MSLDMPMQEDGSAPPQGGGRALRLPAAAFLALAAALAILFGTLAIMQYGAGPSAAKRDTVSDVEQLQTLAALQSTTSVPLAERAAALDALGEGAAVDQETKMSALQSLDARP